MTEMGPAFAIHDLPSVHTVGKIPDEPNGIGVYGCIEAGPAGAGIELGIGAEQRL